MASITMGYMAIGQYQYIYIYLQKSFILRKEQNVNADTAHLLHECLVGVDTTYRWRTGFLNKEDWERYRTFPNMDILK